MGTINEATVSLPPNATMGDKVHALRTSMGISMSELARRSGLTTRSISYYEKNERVPSVDAIKRLSAAMEVDTSFFINDAEFAEQEKQEEFVAKVKSEYGYRGAAQARRLVNETSALFAGGELSEEEQEIFMDDMQELFIKAKRKARAKKAGQSFLKGGENK